MPQDAKSNPSNGLVERLRALAESVRLNGAGNVYQRRLSEDGLLVLEAADALALYQQEGVLSSQRGEDRVLVPRELIEETARVGNIRQMNDLIPRLRAALSASPATPIGGLSLGVEGDQGVSVASRGGTAQAPKSDSDGGH